MLNWTTEIFWEISVWVWIKPVVLNFLVGLFHIQIYQKPWAVTTRTNFPFLQRYQYHHNQFEMSFGNYVYFNSRFIFPNSPTMSMLIKFQNSWIARRLIFYGDRFRMKLIRQHFNICKNLQSHTPTFFPLHNFFVDIFPAVLFSLLNS